MAVDPGTQAAAAAQGPRKSSTGWRIFRILLIGIVVSAALLIAFPPTSLIKDQVAQSLGQAIGRTVTIGDLGLRVPLKLERPKLVVTLGEVAVSNPEGMPQRDVFRGETVRTTLDLFPLFKGRVRMDDLALIKPQFALEEDAEGRRNWVFTPEPAAEATETTEAAASAAPQGPVPAALTLPPLTTVEAGTLTFRSAKTGADRAVGDVNATAVRDAVSGALAAKGSLTANRETVTFDVAVGDFDAAAAGQSSALKASLDSRPLKAALDGEGLFAAEAEFKGDLSASTPSLIDLAVWLGADTTPSGEPLKTSLEGQIVATTRDVAFTDTDLMINTTSSRFDGRLDLGGERPKLAGTFASEHIDLGRILGTSGRTALMPEAAPASDFAPLVAPGWQTLLDDLALLEKGPQAAAAAQAQAEAAAVPSASWSEQPFNLKGLAAIDLDVLINAAAVSYGRLDLKQGRVKADLTDGMLDAKLEELAVGAGKAIGTLKLDSRAAPPRGAVVLNLTDVAAEPIVTEITGNPLLTGTSNVEITATAAGQNQSQLTATLDGKARFLMGKGALRGFDVRRMIFEWWKSWKFDLAQRTSFEKIEAQYDIKKGIMTSQPGLSMGGPEVEINSTGSINVPARRLNQEIRVKAIPPPTAFPIPVRISGDWAKPAVSVDWWGLFSAAPGLGGPQALAAATEPPPAEVEAAIRRVLAADLPPDRLTPEARKMLESLLPPEDVP